MIVGPGGDILAQADPEKPEILLADLDLEAIIPLRFAHDVAGHYNRFDVFRLTVNGRPLDPMAPPTSSPLENPQDVKPAADGRSRPSPRSATRPR